MAVFGPARKAKLSLDARHLVNRLEASRDHVRMGGAVFGAGSVYTLNALSQGLGGAAVGGGVLLLAGAGYATIKLYQHVRTLDRKIEALARETDQALPAQGKRGWLPLDQAQDVVARADPVRPDLVKTIAQRRARRWDVALDPAYRPPVRAPRSNS